MKIFQTISICLLFTVVCLSLTSCYFPNWGFPRWSIFNLPFGLFGLVFYMLPTILAAVRRAKSIVGIVLLNVLAGWTFIGWIIALIWSLTGVSNKQ